MLLDVPKLTCVVAIIIPNVDCILTPDSKTTCKLNSTYLIQNKTSSVISFARNYLIQKPRMPVSRMCRMKLHVINNLSF